MWASPLARGLLHLKIDRIIVHRIIPARAGFTVQPQGARSCPRDHPRSRGVYVLSSAVEAITDGSSPLARGLPPKGPQTGSHGRIIPARAGFTLRPALVRPDGRDHPRSRGVYSAASATPWPTPGSSPLARGLRHTYLIFWPGEGIIPARAGFTGAGPADHRTTEDHPRSRGVYSCGSLESQRTRTLPDPGCLHCRPRARSAELR